MSATERYDVVVIGAGMSGLAAGIRLAQFDQRVVVLERHSLWGGLNSFWKAAGRRFDVGLHALTNFVRPGPGAGGRPLTRVLRQLRIPWESLRLGEQRESWIVFPDTRLRFSNDFALLREEVASAFPDQRQGFERLAADIAATTYDDELPAGSSRGVLAGYLSDPRLVDMLLHPLLWYGSPTPDDLEWPSFVVLWKSIYEEGMARPAGGIRPLLDILRRRLREVGGELRLRAGVAEIVRDGTAERGAGGVRGVRLEDGSELQAPCVLSSAGWVETMQLCGSELATAHGATEAGRLSFVETTSILDALPAELGYDATLVFYNLADSTVYCRPEEAVDVRSGVVSCPDNYAGQEPASEGTFRVTVLANSDVWRSLPDERYYPLKDEAWERALGAVTEFAPDVRPRTVHKDIFTPRTIEHYTGHLNGAVYGAPVKRRSGETPVPGLYLCGTDQGYLGIVGAMFSGIAMANRHALVPA